MRCWQRLHQFNLWTFEETGDGQFQSKHYAGHGSITHGAGMVSSLTGLDSFDSDIDQMDKTCLHELGKETDRENVSLFDFDDNQVYLATAGDDIQALLTYLLCHQESCTPWQRRYKARRRLFLSGVPSVQQQETCQVLECMVQADILYWLRTGSTALSRLG